MGVLRFKAAALKIEEAREKAERDSCQGTRLK